MDKIQGFCAHIRAALACYADLPPEGQARARFYAEKKLRSIGFIKEASEEPGGELAVELLQKMQQREN